MEENQKQDQLKNDLIELTTMPIPQLTLEEETPAEPADIAQKPAEVLTETKFTDEEMQIIREFSEKIDVTNSNMVLQYGSGAQKNIAAFSETALQKVRSKDMGEVGEMLSDLVVELKGFSAAESSGGFFGLFKKMGNQIAKLKARYDKVEVNVDKICEVLEGHQVVLLKDIALFEKMYEMNLAYFKELAMYIEAGKLKLKEVNEVLLPEKRAQAQASGLPEDAQAANDLADKALQFEKRLHDLELTRMISIQMGPQIRLVQNNDSLMVDKINSSLVNTIPLWKSQMLLALGMENSRQAMQAQREVTDMTNELLRQNAEMLKQGSVDVAKESERGIVDMETLVHTNETLIATIDEVRRIQDEGRQKRREAEAELGRIEGELKNKLLEMRA